MGAGCNLKKSNNERNNKPTLKISEKEIEKSILNWLNYNPRVCAWKVNTTGLFDPRISKFRPVQGYSRRGVSDIIGIIAPNGLFFAIEVKTYSGYKSYLRQEKPNQVAQKEFIDEINSCGGLAFVAYNLEMVIENLKGVLK